MSDKPKEALSDIKFEHQELNELGSELVRLGQEVEKAQQTHRNVLAKTVQAFLDNVSKIEGAIRSKRFEHEHTLQSWRGDLEKEKAARGGQLPAELESVLNIILHAEKRVEDLRESIEKELDQIKRVINALPGQSTIPGVVLTMLQNQEKLLLEQKIRWDALDRELEEEYASTDKVVMTTDVMSGVLRNYQNASRLMSDVVNAKGAFEGLDEQARRGVLLRVLDAKGEYMWAHDLLTNPSLAVAVRQFLGGQSDSSWILPLNAVQRGKVSRERFDKACASLRSQNKRHAYPQEYFETRKYAVESKDPEYIKFIQEAWDYWEWTDVAFEWADKGFFILWSPNIVWDNKQEKFVEAGAPRQRIQVDVSGLHEGDNKLGSLPSQLKALYGSAFDMASSKGGVIYLRKGIWPVARDGGGWSLGASGNDDDGGSRWVGVPQKNFQ